MTTLFKTPQGEQAVKTCYQAMLDQWPVHNRHLRLPTRQGETFVLASGSQDKPALVLLHGSASNSASWVADVPLWSQSFNVFAVDLIGEPGLSAPSRPPLASEAYAEWLDDVMEGLGLSSASFVGLSLGGWVALDYAIRRSERVEKLVLLSPGGIGRNRNILVWALPLLLLGSWGRRKMQERIGGATLTAASFTNSPMGALTETIFAHFKPRTSPLPQPTTEQLRRLVMPVMAILGGKDVFIDAPRTRDRLEENVTRLTMRYLPEAPHFIPDQSEAVLDFLRGG
ncbi:carboxylesterase [Cystobacter fuscus]|uniref:Carboxylesterase n=1 Tax=Cystobacter fuscus TaxID=43 RepID=A0A250IV27_9BACT|nr:alpha/beta hydrolase [Cystobacter fuscus]ATB35614.1 carboxylesterase [Cystobacter fuscus]